MRLRPKHYPTDFLSAEFNIGTIFYRIRFKVLQKPQITKVQVLFVGQNYGQRNRKIAQRPVIYVCYGLSYNEFSEEVKKAIRQRYQLASNITLRFEESNKITFKNG